MSEKKGLLCRYYDELEVGERMMTHGRTVTESDIVMWCTLTGDMFRLHTDRHFAETTRFGQRIAPGLMVNAFLAGLGIPPDAPGIIANAGIDEVRFTSPVLIGDTIHLEAEILEKKERKPGQDGYITLQWNAVNQNGRAVMTSRLTCLMACGGNA